MEAVTTVQSLAPGSTSPKTLQTQCEDCERDVPHPLCCPLSIHPKKAGVTST